MAGIAAFARLYLVKKSKCRRTEPVHLLLRSQAMASGKALKHKVSLVVLLLGSCISLYWGVSLQRSVPGGMMGFPGIYYGTRCLLHGCDPYNPAQLQRFDEVEGYPYAAGSPERLESISLYVNLPGTFLVVAPFALLSPGPAHVAWSALVIGSFLLAAYLMWRIGVSYAPGIALFLGFILLSNCEILFAGGNSAGIVVSFSIIAVWCFLKNRFVVAGVVCLAIALVIKPHDAGLIWLYFLIAGGLNRKRALQVIAVAAAFVAAAVLWLSLVAPHWIAEYRTNLATISAPGGINEPGPYSTGVSTPDMVIDLQTVISVFTRNSHVYNLVTYLICGLVFLLWAIAVVRSQFSPQRAWFALVAVAALSMLVTYHRSYDAKLLLLSVPACAMLWSRGGRVAWLALLISTAGVFFTGDIPLAILILATKGLHTYTRGLTGNLFALVLSRPAPLILLITAVFYTWAFARGYSAHETPVMTGPGDTPAS